MAAYPNTKFNDPIVSIGPKMLYGICR